jgi:iron complex transport system permease protein|tara:strand:+ start:2193 stop:3218 length:1026 start_codon:yes stop_codon:yes gene_type:complete
MPRLSFSTALWLCLLLAIIAVTVSITSGAMALSGGASLLAIWDSLWGTQLSSLDNYEQLVVVELRLPRTVLALLIGAILAQCGAVMQGLFRNPLADPGIIGASSGAALGATLTIILLPVSLQGLATPVAAFIGALAITLLVFKLAHGENGTSVIMLLLAGVAVSAFSGAMMGFLNVIADDQALRDITLWQMGAVSRASDTSLILCATVMCFVAWYFQRHCQSLNALLLGEAEARHLGIDVERLKMKLIVAATVGIGVAVSVSGIIGFVGLVIPHLVRMLVGPDHRTLLPLSAFCGAILLLFADIGARSMMAPAELPVGLLTAVVGAPFFVFLLISQRKTFI